MNRKLVDPYCIPGTDILRNVQGYTDKAQLDRFESFSASLAADALYEHPPKIADLPYLKSVHRTLFGQVYPWAGETRRDLAVMKGDSSQLASLFSTVLSSL